MKSIILAISTGVTILTCFTSCTTRTSNTGSVQADSASILLGQTTFVQNCSSCHNFRENGIGPQLGGLTEEVDGDWIRKFIRDPKAMIEGGDERSQLLFEKYGTVMPSFEHYADEEINGIISFLTTQKAPGKKETADDGTWLKNPVPEPIPMSDLVVDLKLIATIPPSSNEGQLTRICKLDFRPDTKTLFVVDLRGKLYQLQKNEPRVYLDMGKEKPQFIHKPGLATGFGSFAFHPEFATNGLLYTTHVESPGSGKADFSYSDSIKVMLQWVLSEWKTDQPNAFPFSGKSRELFRINMVHSFHGVQEITFNPLAHPGDEDYGLLYIGIGDGSSVEMGFPFLAHSLEMIWGTICRIDPAGRNSWNGQYGIPNGNPFAMTDSPSTIREIFAYGFRNPHRISWSKSGQILASNIGHHNIEGLNIIQPGRDYGWPIREGTFELRYLENMSRVYPLPQNDSIYKVTYPVAEYDHDEGKAISGGFEYWGKELPALEGKYLFGDIVKGRLFYVEMADLKLGTQAPIRELQLSFNGAHKTLVELCGANKVDVRFGRDHLGELYVLTKPDGRIYKIVGTNNLLATK